MIYFSKLFGDHRSRQLTDDQNPDLGSAPNSVVKLEVPENPEKNELLAPQDQLIDQNKAKPHSIEDEVTIVEVSSAVPPANSSPIISARTNSCYGQQQTACKKKTNHVFCATIWKQ